MLEINERLRKIRNESHLTLIELSNLLEIPDRTISNYERGERAPSVDYLTLLSTKLNANPEWLLLGKGSLFKDQESNFDLGLPNSLTSNDFTYIPVYDYCGKSFEENRIIDYFGITSNTLLKRFDHNIKEIIAITNPNNFYITEKTLPNIFLIDISKPVLRYDGLYLVTVNESPAIKRVQIHPNHVIELIPDSKYYNSFTVNLNTDNSVELIGKVISYSCFY